MNLNKKTTFSLDPVEEKRRHNLKGFLLGDKYTKHEKAKALNDYEQLYGDPGKTREVP